ncbi:MAG: Nramp family divalent metal transporter [Desulfobulbaceae bacterium]|nr:Nramp family divalent metal transporter [Desulfobulbaceae bacterium]
MRFIKLIVKKCEDIRHLNNGGLEILKYIGPGLLVTVGFIDPGNWAANLAAGAEYGYSLLWMVTLSTFMLIVLQHNAAHLGIVTGKCLAESTNGYLPKWLGRPILYSAFAASCMTSMAEILGGAIALKMLFGLPIVGGACLVTVFVLFMLLSHSYRKIERWIIGFVSLIGLSFLYELFLAPVDWAASGQGWVVPAFPEGSMLVIMSVLGAVVMPHNLFLHSEIIQSRKWHLEDKEIIEKQLDLEFLDTLFSMLIGWAINSAMIILAAAAFWTIGKDVTELEQAQELLRPLLGGNAANIFAIALLMAGVASSVTSGMAGGIITAGIAGEAYNIRDKHSLFGAAGSLLAGLLIICCISDPFQGLLVSQMALSVQLPITMITQVYLTSSKRVMGKYANGPGTKTLLIFLTAIVAALNIMLLASVIK